MPLTMKIQPIDADAGDSDSPATFPVTKPVVRSRLKRLFRISAVEKDLIPATVTVASEQFEPSSVCLAKMVQNFIEENNEKQPASVKCGRNRCNCFNGNESDGSDSETASGHVCGFLKSLAVCASVNERNVLADTAKIVAANKACKRKDELRKLVVEGLMALGHDAAICKSKWEKSPSFPAGEYEYVDVMAGGERLIIDIDFRSEFVVARSTKTYKSILQTLPNIFVGKSDRLSKIICILSEAAKQSLKKKGMHIPPWRKADYVQAKWLSPPTRLVASPAPATPPPSPLTPVGSLIVSGDPSPNKLNLLTPIGSLTISNGPTPDMPVPCPDEILIETHRANESEASSRSSHSETLFDMSESSEEEEVKVKVKGNLAFIMEEKSP
ncbi:uncharacterized protein LOC141653044 [Silene latifolia]|uniref:uncharacterized protein LOC141653044 n=1 Tax=Silene latifolia TaxID=37657 RepID=UPI003D784BBD